MFMELAVCNMPVSTIHIALSAVHSYNKHRALINKMLGGPLQHNHWKLIIKINMDGSTTSSNNNPRGTHPVIPLATSTE